MMDVLSLFLLCIGASFVQRVTGFGFGIFIMTMLPYLLPSYGEATTLSGILALTTSFVITLQMRKYIVWKRLWPILSTFIIVSAIAVFVLARVEEGMLKRILGGALVLISLYFIFFNKRFQLRPTLVAQVGCGTLSGVMGGFFGMQGPPAVLYFLASEPDKEHYMGIAQCYFLIGNLCMTAVRAFNGFFTAAVATGYCYGLGGVLLGTLVGQIVFKRMPTRIFRYCVYAYIGISGLVILFFSTR